MAQVEDEKLPEYIVFKVNKFSAVFKLYKYRETSGGFSNTALKFHCSL